ncbi:MAG: SIR2 family protein [Zymomonas mobilis]|uniref:SIR2 family NAD-dependent protein deacylase n=1 Tax=Zymomonas mobilis TaxID=542 RepID=UPI0039E755D7
MASTDERFRNLADYPSLKKLAAALWKKDDSYHGAAIMVGAGFSRSGAQTENLTKDKLPLWNDFSKILGEELGVNNNNMNPLRLAEEYHAYFGKEALHDLIKKRINDVAWTPGDLHKNLLKLPWSEVLTTNWDTLLERASNDPNQPIYSLVSKQEDLASARSPRIVKLHGTVNITDDLIFTEEDYRKYPQCYAAFVNFARQVFIENELCLLGFSGDDPNFLQWAGWVRDHLSGHARRIYLVGALQLNATKRKYLESLNIAPIDLSDLVSEYDDIDTKHQKAIEKFIGFLEENEQNPIYVWKLTYFYHLFPDNNQTDRPPEYEAKLLESLILYLEKDRESYPGWIICPSDKRRYLSNNLKYIFKYIASISEMKDNYRDKLLYEISWIYSLIYETIPVQILELLFSICNPGKKCFLKRKQQIEIALVLLKKMKWYSEKELYKHINEKKEILISFLESNKKYNKDISNELAYHHAILARDSFDSEALEKNLGNIVENTPIWKMRKASLLAEIGNFKEGELLIEEAYQELLESYRKDRNSIYLFSRLCWCRWVYVKIIYPSPQKKFLFIRDQHLNRCDPQDYIKETKEIIIEHQKVEHSINKKNTIFIDKNFQFESIFSIISIEELSNNVGIPTRWYIFGLLGFLREDALKLSHIDNMHFLSLVINSSFNEDSLGLKVLASRIMRFNQKEIKFIFDQSIKEIKFFGIKLKEKPEYREYFLRKICVFLTVLSKIMIRLNPHQMMSIFLEACNIINIKEYSSPYLFKSLKKLISISLMNIPKHMHPSILKNILSFPLPKDNNYWPEPVIYFPGKRIDDPTIDKIIDDLIDKITPIAQKSQLILARLHPLIKNNFLKQSELKKLANKLWQKSPDCNKFPENSFSIQTLLKFPAPNPSAAASLFKNYFFEKDDQEILNSASLENIIFAAEKNYFPAPKQAYNLFQKLIIWRRKEDSNDYTNITFINNNSLAEKISKALSYSIVPSLSRRHLTEGNFQKLFDYYNQTESTIIMNAMIYFIKTKEHSKILERIIIKNLQTREVPNVLRACQALLEWKNLKKSANINNIINTIIYMISTNNFIILPLILETIYELIQKKILLSKQKHIIIEIIPIIFDYTSSNNLYLTNEEYQSFPRVRYLIIKILKTLVDFDSDNIDILRILEEARTDPLYMIRQA